MKGKVNKELLIERVKSLSAEKGISMAKAFKESAVGKNFKSNLSIAEPSLGKLKLLADYFGTSVEYLRGETDKKEKPEGRPSPSELLGDDDKIISLCRSLPQRKRQQALEYLEYLASQSKKEQSSSLEHSFLKISPVPTAPQQVSCPMAPEP